MGQCNVLFAIEALTCRKVGKIPLGYGTCGCTLQIEGGVCDGSDIMLIGGNARGTNPGESGGWNIVAVSRMLGQDYVESTIHSRNGSHIFR